MKNVKIIFIAIVLFSSCLTEEKSDRSDLDILVHHMEVAARKIQRSAFWQREYYWGVIKWRGKNQDSVSYYEVKMDSVVMEYKIQNRLYDELLRLYEKADAEK